MKKFLFIMLVSFSLGLTTSTNANNIYTEDTGVDCMDFAFAVMGEAGDSGDFDTLYQAFVFCSGVDEVVIEG